MCLRIRVVVIDITNKVGQYIKIKGVDIIEKVIWESNDAAESIKKAILDLNLKRQKRSSNRTLKDFMNRINDEKVNS